MCECGAAVFIVKTQECKKCYHARYRVENRERFRGYDRKAYVPKPMVYTAAVPTTAPCTYDAAHQRIRYWRGLPSQHQCPCGAQAEEWAYRNNGSSYEMSGPRRKLYDSGRWETVTSTWSTHIKDYDALCHECHVYRDRWEPRLAQQEAGIQLANVPHVERPQLEKSFFEPNFDTPAAAPQNPSLINPQEAL